MGKTGGRAGMGPVRLLKKLLHKLLWEKCFTLLERMNLHVLPVHYYSPVPDTRELRRNLRQWDKDWDFTGIDFQVEKQMRLLQRLGEYRAEYALLPQYAAVRAMGLGEGYGEVEAHVLYGMIRHFKPRKIIEVGSGISSYFSLAAIRRNEEEEKSGARIVCIEPFPRKPLVELAQTSKLELIGLLVQDIDGGLFRSLAANDILFIDSSHVAKINSDVCHLYLEILPLLSAGVIIHVHDIPFPRLTPADVEHWIFRKHQFWNEAAILKAFLTFNEAFEIMLCTSYLHYRDPAALQSIFEIYNRQRHFPTSLWLRKAK